MPTFTHSIQSRPKATASLSFRNYYNAAAIGLTGRKGINMSKIELFRLTVIIIDKYNEEYDKSYPESYFDPNKKLLTLDEK